MGDYKSYREETDVFSEKFDAAAVLAKDDVSGVADESVDVLEQDLLKNDPDLVDELKTLDELLEPKVSCEKPVKDRRRRKELQKQAEKAKYEDILRRTGIEYFSNFGYAMAHGGLYERLREWVRNQTRVTIKLHASSSKMKPNRCIQAAIVAFDKHWNLIVRDCDEVYSPANRLGHVQTYKNAMPLNFVYKQVNDTNILSRYLRCSLIMGQTIICIYQEQS